MHRVEPRQAVKPSAADHARAPTAIPGDPDRPGATHFICDPIHQEWRQIRQVHSLTT